MNASKIIEAMLILGYESPISVELDTLDIWLGTEDEKKTLTKTKITEIKDLAETLE